MILLLGSSGYIGREFSLQLEARGWPTHTVRFSEFKPEMITPVVGLVINSAAFIPQPSVSACNDHHRETFRGNVFFPALVTNACEKAGIPILHLSTGCLFDEAKDYSETDKPMRGWHDHCGYYVGTKLMAEEIVSGYEKHWIARIRLPFDEQDSPRNYLSKLIKYPQVYDHDNSLCHRADIVAAMLDMIEKRVPFGIYNVANPGAITAWDVVAQMEDAGIIKDRKEFVPGPCKGTRLDVSKLISTGVKIRTVQEALTDAITNWTPCTGK